MAVGYWLRDRAVRDRRLLPGALGRQAEGGQGRSCFMNKPIVVVGSLNADLVTRLQRFPIPGETLTADDFHVFAGGKGANQAYAASRLGGVVHMVGRVGRDSYGKRLIEELQGGGVNTCEVALDDGAATGMAFVSVDASGQNQIVIVAGSNAAVSANNLVESAELLASAGCVLLQLEIPVPAVLVAARMAKAGGARVILDPAPAAELPDELLQLVDWLTPNETELSRLLRLTPSNAMDVDQIVSCARKLQQRGVKQVVVKRGDAGVLCLSGHTTDSWPAFRVEAHDTVAAGDVWNGAFAVGLSEGESPENAGRFANAAASLSVTRPGAQASMPSRSEVTKFLSRSVL